MATVDEQAEALVADALEAYRRHVGRERELPTQPELRALLEAPDDLRWAAVRRLVVEGDGFACSRILKIVLRRRLDLDAYDLKWLLEALAARPAPLTIGLRIGALTGQIEFSYRRLDADVAPAFGPMLQWLADMRSPDTETRARLRQLAARPDHVPYEWIARPDDIGPRLRSVLESSDEPDPTRGALLTLLAGYPLGGRPPKRWQREADRVCGVLRDPAALVRRLLGAVLEASDLEWEDRTSFGTFKHRLWIQEGNEPLVAAVAELAGRLGDPACTPLLRQVAARAASLHRGAPRSLRVARACIVGLGASGVPSAVGELQALERSVTNGVLLRTVREALDALAAARQLSRDQLLERTVEHHGLEADGTRTVPLTRGAALLQVEARGATLVHVEADRRSARFPAAVRTADAAVLGGLREQLKAVRRTVAGERLRLENLLATRRRWALDDWRAHYLEHPLTGCLTRALVWRFAATSGDVVVGLPRDAATVVTSSGSASAIPAGAEVRLWHPIEATAEELHAWRRQVLDRLVVQPFRQVFRELYLPTPGELDAASHSERFAGHVIGHVQARALMKRRGWRSEAIGGWEGGEGARLAVRPFPDHDVRAELFLDVDPQPPPWTDRSSLATLAQLRFFSADGLRAIAIGDLPPLVFSEALRDVDLFTSVTSLGTGGLPVGEPPARGGCLPWPGHALDELTPMGELRREVLAHVVPRLEIADRCTLDDRYLVVDGDLHRYRIHIGSAFVVIATTDECIGSVPGREPPADVLSPFDDPRLHEVVGAALLLARDTAITEHWVAARIRRA